MAYDIVEKLYKLYNLLIIYKTIIISFCALALGTTLIYIGSPRDNLITILKVVLRDIGIVFIGVGLVSLFYDFFLREDWTNLYSQISKSNSVELRKIIEENSIKLTKSISDRCDFKPLQESGLVNAYPTEGPNIEIDPTWHNIKMLGITIGSFFNPGDKQYNKLLNFINGGGKLQILMLNPKSKHVAYRQEDENNNDLKGQIEKSFKIKKHFIDKLSPEFKPNVEIFFYDAYPLYAMTIIDDCFIRVTPFLYKKLGRECPSSDYRHVPGGLFESYSKHFIDLWEAKRILFNWLEVPGNDTDLLKEFLELHYGISCPKETKFEKSNDNREITVATEKNILSLRLNSKQTKAILTIDFGRTDEFIVEAENSRLNVYAGTINALATN